MTAPRLPLGKLPARKGAVTFKLDRYLIKPKLPPIPKEFGHENIGQPWGMLGNDRIGDCVLAGAAHEHMLWTDIWEDVAPFSDDNVISAYSKITGYRPGDPSTDNGTDMQAAATWRRNWGIEDAHGQRHKILAYLAINPRSIRKLYQALYLFGAVGIGVRFPVSAYEQMDQGKPWSWKPGSRIVGGHYVPVVAKRKHLQVVTWGQTQAMTTCWYRRYNDESIVYLTEELLDRQEPRLTREGINLNQLLADLAALG